MRRPVEARVSTDPFRRDAVETVIYETVIYEPDEQAVGVLPGALWMNAGAIVELDDPARQARVLSSRLQVRTNEPARVLVVLDVPDAALPSAPQLLSDGVLASSGRTARAAG